MICSKVLNFISFSPPFALATRSANNNPPPADCGRQIESNQTEAEKLPRIEPENWAGQFKLEAPETVVGPFRCHSRSELARRGVWRAPIGRERERAAHSGRVDGRRAEV